MFSFPFVKKELDVIEASEAEKALLTGLPEYLLPYVVSTISSSTKQSLSVKLFGDIDTLALYVTGSIKQNENLLLNVGEDFQVNSFIELGYENVRRVWEQGEISIFGDVVVFWPFGATNVIRLSLLGETIEQISIVDVETRRKIKDVESISLSASYVSSESGYKDIVQFGSEFDPLSVELLYIDNSSLIDEELSKLNIPIIDMNIKPIPMASLSAIAEDSLEFVIKGFVQDKYEICFIDKNRERYDEWSGYVKNMSEFYRLSEDDLSLIPKGFVDEINNEVVITRYEAFGEVDLSDPVMTDSMEDNDRTLTEEIIDRRVNSEQIFKKITPGDYVVHEDHGVGLFDGIVDRKEGVFMKIQYAGKDRLFVPLRQASKVTRYIASNTQPRLTRLNNGSWRKVRDKADKESERLARELIQIYAMRQVNKIDGWVDVSLGEMNDPTEMTINEKIDEFIKDFEFQDTEDQMIATEEIINDLSSEVPMDRLLVGDVGFGKTEVAMRAMYATLLRGKQVMMLAPTTVLVEQHRALLEERFGAYGIRVGAMSRYLSSAEKELTKHALRDGEIDLVVGTHSLLSEDVELKDLGLIVIDEEQKFGVKQKELLKLKRIDCHMLSMSATPIPRTLNMALSGIRDISIIRTAPLGRKPIINNYAKFSWTSVNKAISKELDRGGQVYFVHNRVKTIDELALKISAYFPEHRVEVAHGQLSPEQLSSVIYKFAKREIDILVCTTIIENGIDLPNVNTLIIDRSEMFGLSQMYQIRGRVGRSEKQAYAYFFYNKLVGRSSKRLRSLGEAERLGSGFIIASKDMEIRGVGEILGRKQSGSISEVGYGMFINMLQEKVSALRAQGVSN